ncbi:MAG: adenosine kinase [Pelagibacteraceae bacterium]|nr:adenosine kinase [Pelagibacteraceae bacterium]OUV88390.1 MAG: adenosine kinase [Pelagibacteraceae bacterium TMED146]|tara:strand:+ start:1477 stop:2406 length:930 start_codon:yes stop_codon:yes gene_type:complete
MKVLGIGNAIVDVLCKVDDQFIKDHALTKGTMKLVDEQEFKRLLSNLKIESTVSGGSVANSIVGMSQLGDDVSFIGKVNDDDFGHKYIDGLKKENVDYFYNVKKVNIPTGTCLILITPDSERTMCTFLGIAGQIDDNDIDANAIQSAEITFLEGYLWDEGGPTKAFEKALSAAKKSAMSLSDPFCVDRHKESFLNLVKNKLDIIFANEKEAMSLIDAKNFDEVVDFGKSLNKLFIVTRSDKGSVAIEGNDVSEAQAKSNLNIVDLTGAGDLFAAGFLHGFTNNKNPHESLKLGTEMASKIIQKIGARLD